jgi:hypothetical protein
VPLPDAAKYRWKTFPSGKKVRLAFDKGGDVIEAKSGETGAVHTEAEFKADRHVAQKKALSNMKTKGLQ